MQNSTLVLFVLYENTSTTLSFNLSQSEQFDESIYSVSLTLNLSGNYFYKFRIIRWIYYNDTELQLFRVYEPGQSFPKTAYINYWTPYSTFPIPSTLKQYVSSTDELKRICNFEDFEGRGTNLSWQAMHDASSKPINFSVQNRRIYLQTTGNGIKANLEETINISVHDSLYFQLKIKSDSEFVNPGDKAFYIVLNPSAWQADYRLNLADYDLDEWITLIIPFKLFTYVYQQDALAEIGFYSPASAGFLDCEIREIYAADYNTFQNLADASASTINSSIDNQIHQKQCVNDTDISFTSNENVYNLSESCNSSFNNTNAEWNNYTLEVTSSVIKTNNSGWYEGYQNFRNMTEDDFATWLTNGVEWQKSQDGTSTFSLINAQSNKCVLLNDSDSAYPNAAGLAWLLSASQQGSITSVEYVSFWTNCSPLTSFQYLYFYQRDGTTSSLAIALRPYGSTWHVLGSNHSLVDTGVSTEEWNHFTLRIDVPNHYILVYINSSLSFSFDFYDLTKNRIDHVNFGTSYMSGESGALFYVDGFDRSNYYTNQSMYWEFVNASYVSNAKNFNQSVDVYNVSYSISEFVNANISVQVATNQTGSFDFVNASDVDESNVLEGQFFKFKVIFNTSFTREIPEFYNITLFYHVYSYNLSQNHSVSFDFLDDVYLRNASLSIRVKTNVSTEMANVSIFNFSSNSWMLNQSFDEDYEELTFSNLTGDFFNNSAVLLHFETNGSNAHEIDVDYVNLTFNYSVYDKSGVVANYTVSLTENAYRLTFDLSLNDSKSFLLFNITYLDGSSIQHNLTSSGFESFNLSNPESITNFVFVVWKLNSSIQEENATGSILDVTVWSNNTYRLESEANRQNGNELTIPSQEFYLLLTDYYGNWIFREKLNYSQYIDILVPYFTISVTNNANEEVLFKLEKFSTTLEFVIAPQTTLYVDIVEDDYEGVVIYRGQEYVLFDRAISRTSQRSFSFNQEFELEPDNPPLNPFLQFYVLLDAFMDNAVVQFFLLVFCTLIPVTYFYYKSSRSWDDLLRSDKKAVKRVRKQKVKERKREFSKPSKRFNPHL